MSAVGYLGVLFKGISKLAVHRKYFSILGPQSIIKNKLFINNSNLFIKNKVFYPSNKELLTSGVSDLCGSNKLYQSVTSIVKPFCSSSGRCENLFALKRRNCSTMAEQIVNEAREFRISVPYGHIAGKVWNEGAPVAVLCLHGWQDNAGTFDLLAPLLPQHLCLVAIDFPGHGLSTHKPLGFSSNGVDYVITVDRVVKHYGWKQVIIMGHSMGGGIGMLYAGTRPSVVHSLVMLDMIKPLHVSPGGLPERMEVALDALADVEHKILHKSKPQYTYEEITKRAMSSQVGSWVLSDEKGARTLLKRGATRQPNGLYSFNYDLQIRTPSVFMMSLDQLLAFAGRLTARLLLLRAQQGIFAEEKDTNKLMLDKYKSSPEFVYLTVPGSHHTHLATPEHVAPHITDFLSVERLQGFSNNRTEEGGSVVTLADANHQSKA